MAIKLSKGATASSTMGTTLTQAYIRNVTSYERVMPSKGGEGTIKLYGYKLLLSKKDTPDTIWILKGDYKKECRLTNSLAAAFGFKVNSRGTAASIEKALAEHNLLTFADAGNAAEVRVVRGVSDDNGPETLVVSSIQDEKQRVQLSGTTAIAWSPDEGKELAIIASWFAKESTLLSTPPGLSEELDEESYARAMESEEVIDEELAVLQGTQGLSASRLMELAEMEEA